MFAQVTGAAGESVHSRDTMAKRAERWALLSRFLLSVQRTAAGERLAGSIESSRVQLPPKTAPKLLH